MAKQEAKPTIESNVDTLRELVRGFRYKKSLADLFFDDAKSQSPGESAKQQAEIALEHDDDAFDMRLQIIGASEGLISELGNNAPRNLRLFRSLLGPDVKRAIELWPEVEADLLTVNRNGGGKPKRKNGKPLTKTQQRNDNWLAEFRRADHSNKRTFADSKPRPNGTNLEQWRDTVRKGLNEAEKRE